MRTSRDFGRDIVFKKVTVITEGGEYWIFNFKLIPYLCLFCEKPIVCAVELFHWKDTYWLFDFIIWKMERPYWRYAIRKTIIEKEDLKIPR